MKRTAFLLSLFLLPSLLSAQGFRFPGNQQREEDEIPLLTPEERKAVESQRDQFANAFAPALGEASKSTVRIFFKNRRGVDQRAAYGVVIGDGSQILTKWSEVAGAQDDFRAGTVGREVRPVKVTSVYPEEDLAVLTIEGAPLTPVKWTEAPLELGTFLVASQPDGRPAGYGVVSVLERSLREQDQGALGVLIKKTDDGVVIDKVLDDSGAANAGMKSGDVIVMVAGRQITSASELQNSVWGAKPGTEVDVVVRRAGNEMPLKIILGEKQKPEQLSGDRLFQMERMGSRRLSKVRAGFPRAVETDMVIEAESVGGPVANLKGEVVGITISRAGRTRSYVMTTASILNMLKKEGMDPSLAIQKDKEAKDAELAARQMKAKEAPARGKTMNMDEFQNLQRHQGDMAKLMQRIESELKALENGE